MYLAKTTVKELQQFLGLANYYAQYICHYIDIAALLTDLTSPKQPWTWDADQDRVFDQLRELLCNSPVIRLPNFELPFVIDTDACHDATGAVLLQQYDDGVHPIAYHSTRYAPAERNYGGGEKELLAIYQSCVKWRYYIDGVLTTIYTDHQPWVNIWKQPYLSHC